MDVPLLADRLRLGGPAALSELCRKVRARGRGAFDAVVESRSTLDRWMAWPWIVRWPGYPLLLERADAWVVRNGRGASFFDVPEETDPSARVSAARATGVFAWTDLGLSFPTVGKGIDLLPREARALAGGVPYPPAWRTLDRLAVDDGAPGWVEWVVRHPPEDLGVATPRAALATWLQELGPQGIGDAGAVPDLAGSTD